MTRLILFLTVFSSLADISSSPRSAVFSGIGNFPRLRHTLVPPYIPATPSYIPAQHNFPSPTIAPSEKTTTSRMSASSIRPVAIPGTANLPGPMQIPMPPLTPILPYVTPLPIHPGPRNPPQQIASHPETKDHSKTTSSATTALSVTTSSSNGISAPPRTTPSSKISTPRTFSPSSRKTTRRRVTEHMTTSSTKTTASTNIQIDDLQEFLKHLVEQYNNCAEKWLILDLDRQWEIYWKIFGKEYIEEEKEARKAMFKRNRDEMIKHNELCKKSLMTYNVGLNHFSDRTEEELEELNGFQPSNATLHGLANRAGRSIENTTRMVYDYDPDDVLPDSFVWSKDHVTPVKNQGECGSCYAFAGNGALEAYEKKKTGVLVELSAQNILDCTWHLENNGCDGGDHHTVFEYARTEGVVANFWYLYTMNASHNCRWKREYVAATDRGFYIIPRGNEIALQHAVANLGPVAIGIGTKHLYPYRSGIFHTSDCGPPSHSALLVGYGSDPWAGDYWIIKNCWGFDWGENGYVRIARNKHNMCHIASDANLPF